MRSMNERLYIGSNGHVCAIDPGTGVEIWRTRLQESALGATRSGDVSVIVRGGTVFAGSQGHLFALSAESGAILWHNELKGLRFNDVSLAFDGVSVQYMQKTVRSHSHSSPS
jgi:outer membrane protein assembly factor BamB